MLLHKPCNLVFVSASLEIGGAEKVISLLANSLQAHDGIKVSVVTLINAPIEFKINENIKVYKPEFNYKKFNRLVFTVKTFFYLRRTLRLINADKIICFGGKYNSFTILSSIGLKSHIYISERSRPGISYGRFLDCLNFWVYRLADGYIAQTQHAANVLQDRIGKRNVLILPNPVDSNYKTAVKKDIILNVGRFVSTKRQDLLIDYFSAVKNQNWELYFVGDGPYLAVCKEKVQQMGLDNRVFFLGAQKDPSFYYGISKIFAFTSVSEGFPNVLIEAMASGCACISFNCESGPSEIIKNEVNGFLIEMSDERKYINTLENLIDNTELLNRISSAALIRVKEYDINNLVNKLILYINNEPCN